MDIVDDYVGKIRHTMDESEFQETEGKYLFGDT